MAAMTPAQQLAEAKRKAGLGISLSDTSNKANQNVWNTTRTSLNNEINRKADAGVALADAKNAYNNNLYNARINANKANSTTGTDQPAQPTPTPGTTTAAAGPAAPDINGIYDNYYTAAAAKLRAAREQALAGLAGQDDLVKQSAYANRNSNDVVANQRVTALKEAMANQGLASSGDSVTGQLAVGTAQQQGANDINTNEGNQLKQLLAARDAINNSSSAEEAALLAQNQGDRMNALLGQYNADRGYGLQEGGLTGTYNGNRTLAGQQFDYGKTTDQRNFDYQQGRDKVGDSQWQKGFDFQKSTQEWNQNFQQGQFNWQKASDMWDRTFKEKNFQQQVKDAAASRGLQWANLDESRKARVADDLFREKSFGLQQSQFNWSKDPTNPDNVYKLGQAGGQAGTANDYAKFIDTSPSAYTSVGFGPSAIKTPNKSEIEKMILGSGLSSSEMSKLYQRYGIQMQ